MLIGINGGYFPAICRVCFLFSQDAKANAALEKKVFFESFCNFRVSSAPGARQPTLGFDNRLLLSD